MPVGPSANLLEVHARLWATSSSVMGLKRRGGRGGRSSRSESGIGLGMVGKNQSDKT